MSSWNHKKSFKLRDNQTHNERTKMTSIRTFLTSKPNDLFIERETGEEYTKTQLDESFQYEQMEGSVTIKEYYLKLIEFLSNFRKIQHKKQPLRNKLN